MIDVAGIGCAIIATGIPVYVVFIYWTSKPKDFNRFIGRFFVNYRIRGNTASTPILQTKLNMLQFLGTSLFGEFRMQWRKFNFCIIVI